MFVTSWSTGRATIGRCAVSSIAQLDASSLQGAQATDHSFKILEYFEASSRHTLCLCPCYPVFQLLIVLTIKLVTKPPSLRQDFCQTIVAVGNTTIIFDFHATAGKSLKSHGAFCSRPYCGSDITVRSLDGASVTQLLQSKRVLLTMLGWLLEAIVQLRSK